jgi:hypothetical protein
MNARYLCTFALLLGLAVAPPTSAQLYGLPGDPCETGFVDCGLDDPPYDDSWDECVADGHCDPIYSSWDDCIAAGDCETAPLDGPEYDTLDDCIAAGDCDPLDAYDSYDDCVAAGECAPLNPTQKACQESYTCGLPEDSVQWIEDLEAFYVPDLKLYFDPETGEWFDEKGKVLSEKEAKDAAKKIKNLSKLRKLTRASAGGPVGLLLHAIRSLF